MKSFSKVLVIGSLLLPVLSQAADRFTNEVGSLNKECVEKIVAVAEAARLEAIQSTEELKIHEGRELLKKPIFSKKHLVRDDELKIVMTLGEVLFSMQGDAYMETIDGEEKTLRKKPHFLRVDVRISDDCAHIIPDKKVNTYQ